MDTIAFDCPYCGHRLVASPDKVGREMECPECKRQLKVPASSSLPFTPPQPPPLPTSSRMAAPGKLDNKVLAELRQRLSEKPTDELVAIWSENDRASWRNEAFVAVAEILTSRGIPLPQQKPFDTQAWSQKTLANRGQYNEALAYLLALPPALLVGAGIFLVVLGVGYALSLAGLPIPTKPGTFAVLGGVAVSWKLFAMRRLRRVQDKERRKIAEQVSRGDF